MNIGINALFRWAPTGVANYICNLVCSLAEIDQVHQYYVFVHESNKKYFPVQNPNFHFVTCDVDVNSPTRRRIWEQTALPRLVRKLRIDVLHCPMNILPVANGCRSVVTIIDTQHFQYPQFVSFFRRVYHKWLVRLSARRADSVITISHSVRKEIEAHIGCKRGIRVIHLGVDRSFRVIHSDEAIAEAKKHYRIPHKYILFVGYPHFRKNIPRLVEAFGAVRRRLSEPYSLVLAGDMNSPVESDAENIRRIVRELDLSKEVLFTNYIPGDMDGGSQHAGMDDLMPRLMTGAEVIAYPSLYEGFGLPVLEAMACGTPVLASDIPVMEEVAGDAALLVDPYRVDAIADGLSRLLTDDTLRKQLVEKGFRRVRSFSWEENARQTLKCYEQVAS